VVSCDWPFELSTDVLFIQRFPSVNKNSIFLQFSDFLLIIAVVGSLPTTAFNKFCYFCFAGKIVGAGFHMYNKSKKFWS
jgi:hypothetical protein